MSLTIQLPLTTEHYLRENATREGMPLERYISQLLTATSVSSSAKNKKKPLTEKELLKHIQLDVQIDDLQAYVRLKEIFKLGKLTEQERETLIQLNDLIEIAHAKRMGYVLQLAKLRNISLEKAMVDLGIKHLNA
jgi:hypothetical protein